MVLTTGQDALVTAVTTLQADNKANQRIIKKLNNALLESKIDQMIKNGRKMADFILISQVFAAEDDINLRQLGARLTQNGGVVVLLAIAGAKTQLLFCRSKDAPGDMNTLLQAALAQLGGGGGGSAEMAQGGGAEMEHGRLTQLLSDIQQMLPA